jgi:dissimilatory sulfite reductase (desulfoviridin) alpha/beta subunit
MGFWKDLGEGIKDAVGEVGGFVSDIGRKAYDWITGEDVKDAANAQARVYENMARESYRQGELTREAGLRRFRTQYSREGVFYPAS